MKGIGVAALMGGVSFLLSYGFLIHEDLKFFSVLAAGGSMAGYAVGDIASKRMTHGAALAFLVFAHFLLLLTGAIYYVFAIERGSADIGHLVCLAVSLAFAFYALFFLMPIAGVLLQDGDSRDA